MPQATLATWDLTPQNKSYTVAPEQKILVFMLVIALSIVTGSVRF